jgi:uncharacterized protein YjbI with pentapeptide repeats
MERPVFIGNPNDLSHFMELAISPPKSEQREHALSYWEDYKLTREVEEVRSRGGRFGHARLLANANRVIDLRGARLDGICVGGANLRGVMMDGASLRGAWLVGAKFRNASLKSANFSPLPLNGDDVLPDDKIGPYSFGWGCARLGRSDFSDADMSGVNLIEAELLGANLGGASLYQATLAGANLSEANLTRADIRNANLRGAVLEGANLTGAKLQQTDLCGCRIYGLSAWDIELDDNESLRCDLIVTPQGQPEAKVDSIELAQFVYLLQTQPKIRDVLEIVSKKAVLILGRFGGGGLEVLRSLGDGLRKIGYVPMIFDFARPQDRTYTDTVRTLAAIARFVVVDLSGPSVPQELSATVPYLKIPFVPILEKGKQPYSMFIDLLENEWVLKPILEFESTDDLLLALPDKIISPAEKQIEIRRARLSTLFTNQP